MIGMENGITQLPFDFPAKEIIDRELLDLPEAEKEAVRTLPLILSS